MKAANFRSVVENCPSTEPDLPRISICARTPVNEQSSELISRDAATIVDGTATTGVFSRLDDKVTNDDRGGN